jgi:hypothetical protein
MEQRQILLLVVVVLAILAVWVASGWGDAAE